MASLKVVTLNIWNYNEPWLERRELLANELIELSPDVIGFQEIRDDQEQNVDGLDQAAQFAQLLEGYEYIFQPAMHYPSEHPSCEGVAIFSRLPVRSHDYIKLSRTDDYDDHHKRVLLHAELEGPGCVVDFYVTHFSLSSVSRKLQAQEVLEYVGQTAKGDLTIVAGDFNDSPESATYALLTGEGGFEDLWVATQGEAEGGTWPSDEPVERIDYIFCRPALSELPAGTRCEVTQLVTKAGPGGLMGTDHRGLMAHFELPG